MWDKTFLLLLHSVKALVASQCWQGATFSEAVVSPAVESSGILRVPGVASLPQCVAACCDLLGYDLAWLFEGRCYILSCQQRENCQPRERPGSDSVLAFLRRASPQTLVLQSLVRGEPYGGRWRPLSRSPEVPGALQDFPDVDMLDVEYSDGSQEERGGPGLEVEVTDRPSLRRADRLNQSEAGDGPESSMVQNSTSSWRNVSQGDEDETRRLTDPVALEKTVSDEIQSAESSKPAVETSGGSHAVFKTTESPLSQCGNFQCLINTKTQNSTDSTSLLQTPTADSTHHDHMRTSLPVPATPHWTISSSIQPDRPLMLSPGNPVESPTPEPDASVSPQTTAGMLKSSAGAPPTTTTTTTTQPPAGAMTSDLNTTTCAPSTIPPTTTSTTSMTAAAAESASQVRGSNRGPVAVVGPDRTLFLPLSSFLLDGSGSSDDRGIVRYHWDAVSGPPGLKVEGGDQVVATATGLRMGRYVFRLTVSDQEEATDSVSLTVRVQEARSLPPVAHASGSHTLTLPNNSLVLRGSITDGDQTEVQYLWVRDHQSPAAGDVLYGSDTQASLYLANLVEGTYLFQLRVIDAQGRSSRATATVEVQPESGGGEEVELEMLVSVSQVSVAQRDTVVRQLAALLHVFDSDIRVRALQGHSHLSTVLRFSVRGPSGLISGSRLVGLLRNQLLREKSDFLLFRVLRVDTVLCLLRCSGRGQCNPITKECTCDPFWTENLIRRYLGDGESNCEWRLLYVILTSFTLMVFILSVSWTFICCCKRRRQMKVKKKTKYTILDNMDEQERVELRPKFSIKHRSTEHNSSLMMSESELDSDQDRLSAQAARNGNAFG